MSEGLNKVMLLGNLGADPELRMSQGGQAILKLRLATSENYLDKSNTRQERTEWHAVTVFGKRGEALGKFLKKGDRLFIEGGLRTSSYEKDGEKRYRTEIVATNVLLNGKGSGAPAGQSDFGGPPPERRGSGGGGFTGNRPPAAPPKDDFSAGDFADDNEVPF